MSRDGIRKLTRHIKETKVLTKLNCVGLPVTQEGSALLARAVIENHTLVQVALPLGHCHDTPERQQMLQQLGVGLANHPSLQSFACTRTPNLEYASLRDAKENKVRAFPPERSSGWPRAQMAVYMWLLSASKAELDRFTLGPSAKPKVEYPKEACQGANPDLIPASLGMLHSAGHMLRQVSIALPLGYGLRSMELLRVLTVCTSLAGLKVLGFASAVLKDTQLPPEWTSIGSAPRWLFEDRLQRRRIHWQALHGLLSALPHLEQFNDLALGGPNMRESPELTCLLLMQCLEGVATELTDGGGSGEALLKASLQAEADVDAFCDVLRILSRTPLLIDLNFSDKRAETDGTPDELFYLIPRIGVYHVDDAFRAQLRQLYKVLIPAGGQVLDLCSQHDSHLPTDVNYELTVHGMNQLELLANTRAASRFTRNFNNDPTLPEFEDDTFDAVLMAVSIQYMQNPVRLISEVRRVLRPGGTFIVSFSNRMFFTKAVEVWRSQKTMRGLADLVMGYFSEAGFTDVQAANRVRGVSDTDWLRGDPFIAVVGIKEPGRDLSGLDGVKAQQARLGPHLSSHAEGVPRFVHAISLRNNVVSEALLQGLDCSAALREFGFENISAVLPALFAAMCGREKPLPVERIRVEPKWITSRFARKRFKKRQHSWLDGIQAALIRSDRFVELVSAGTAISRAEIEGMAPKDFVDALTGVALEEPFPVEAERLHPPQIQVLCFPSRRAYKDPPEDPSQNLYLPLPMDDEARGELQLQKVSLLMCGLRNKMLQARPDEWPESSKPLWLGQGSHLRFVRPGDELDAPRFADEEGDEDMSAPTRFHWRPDLRLSSSRACARIAEELDPREPTFADNLLHESLRSLLHEDSPVQDLDLRGNGLTREDANLLLDLVCNHRNLVRLNQLPVMEDEAATCKVLHIDGIGIVEPAKQQAGDDDPYGDEDEEDPVDEAYAKEVFETSFARMDDGDTRSKSSNRFMDKQRGQSRRGIMRMRIHASSVPVLVQLAFVPFAWAAQVVDGTLAWDGLRDGLKAWQSFEFDSSFTFEVANGSHVLFRYPLGDVGDLRPLQPSETTEKYGIDIRIHGQKSDLLRQVSVPAVLAILDGKDPAKAVGPGSVSRSELLSRGGGLTLPALVSLVKGHSSAGGWQLLQDGLDAWASLGWDKDFSFNVGSAKGPLYTYTKGTTGMNKRLRGASLSKWPAALAIAGLVADGTLSFDDKANKYLAWWSTDSEDPRSRITLRDLMTFQSGYTKDPKLLCSFNPWADFLSCARHLYETAKLTSPPGETWAYISIHLQLAAAMAVAASGLRPDKLFQKYLYDPLGMNGTTWTPARNPQFAFGITTTGSDFEKMLQKLLSYEFLGREVLSEMEKDWSAPPVSPCGDGWFGHYGMGHWFDCMGYGSGHDEGSSAALSAVCLKESIQAGPGAYGYFPLIDRQRGFYMQIVLAEDSRCRSEIPEYLRIITKPVVDALVLHEPISNERLLQSSVVSKQHGLSFLRRSLPRLIRSMMKDFVSHLCNRHALPTYSDGYLFLQLVTPNSFPELREVTLRRLEIPHDSTLAHLTDALLNLRSVEVLRISDLRLSSRGASLLLQAVAELAPRLVSLNGLPLSRLVQLKDHPEGGAPLELSDSIEWNDFTLGVMARLALWSVVAFAGGAGGAGLADLKLEGHSLTDVGLRGLCAMLRHFAGQGASRSGGLVNLTKIDLSGNLQITDATVTDLCHTLKTPYLSGALRGGLCELNLRGCLRLKTRSAYELLNFMQHSREGGATGSSLRMVNGVDMEALQAIPRSAGGGGSRQTAPPMLLRNFLDASLQASGGKVTSLASMSECDIHFFAGVMHHFQTIPYCHVHIVVSPYLLTATSGSSEFWGRPAHQAGAPCSNDSPFPPPVEGGKVAAVAARLQAHIDSTCRLFEACPILAELRVSMVPSVPGCEDLLASAGHDVLITPAGNPTGSGQSAMDSFGFMKQRLQDKAARRRKAKQKQGQPGGTGPPKALYVNNINRQRLHCCYRTLYGKDDAELTHHDVMPPDQLAAISLPGEVDVSGFFAVATSVDLQHLDLGPAHITKLPELTELPALTHVNLNYNHLGDAGTELLFRALVDTGSSVEHVALVSNDIGDEGASIIAASLGNLPRLTSIELCDNFIQERGSIAIAEAIGGVAPPEEGDDIEAVSNVPLPVLSVDLRGNRSRELGARRWAEVVCNHPDLKFLNLAQNELGLLTKEIFLDLVCAAVTSASLSVLDLQDNFPAAGLGSSEMGPPPPEVSEVADPAPAAY
ncbi:RANGAP1 [Symbiodinium necroappetens]|uniref:RANGAP1 protein n=1 Tax=Symbiodinium necroappetens TaxID=1628268 RepID=A0A812UKZ2_9DINO|nr:RANGAP1 [Symbiodinium necroappetens]